MIEPCPLCHFTTTSPFFNDNRRDYLCCPQCKLIFVSRGDLLNPQQEKARYDLHQNNPEDAGYHQFLNQFIKPFLKRIGPPPQHGLDFGSGPGPVLAMILEKQGYKMSLYDPYYSPDPTVLQNTYDFVTCTETIEHFNNPDRDWRLLISLLKPDAWLGIMTQLVQDEHSLPSMHYITDMTHVSFFCRETFEYLANRDNLHLEFEADNLIFIKSKHR